MAFTPQDDKTIADFVAGNLSNPQAIADAAKQFNVGLNDLARATGYDTNTINNYFSQAKITPYWTQATAVNNGIAGLPAAQSVPSFTQPITLNPTGAVRSVIEGDDIDQQIAQRPEEVSHWSRNGQYMEQIDDKTGAILDRRLVPVMSDTQLLTTGLSMVPGAAPFVQGFNALNAANSGNVLGLITSAAGLGGATDVANAANLANAVKNKDLLSTILAGSNVAGANDIGGMNTQDLAKIVNAASAVKTGNVAGLLNSAVDYLQPGATVGSTPVGTDTRNIATKDINSSITAPTDTQSLLSILNDNSGQIIKDAPFVFAEDTTRKSPDYSNRSFNSAFAAARALGEPDFTWKGNSYNTELAPSLNAGPMSGRTINTGAGMDPAKLANWGGSKIDPNLMKVAAPNLGWDPSTYFPKVDVRMADPTGALGNVPETGYRSNQQTYLNLAPYLTKSEATSPGSTADVLSHELAHVGQVLSSKPGEDISKLYLRMADQAGLTTTDVFNRKSDITKFNQALNEAIPYISETYGTNAGTYLGNPKAPLFEKLTDLAAIEMQTGKDLTKDPVLKETLFKDPKVVAMYNTMTIPRMSRLDPRDLPTGTVTTSDFPKGTVPLTTQIKNLLPSPSKGWVKPYAAGGLAGGGLTQSQAQALESAYAAGDISTVNQLLSSGITAEDVKNFWGFTDADIAGLSGSGINFSQPTNTTANDFLDIVSPPADNITSTGGVTKSAVTPTSGGVRNVIEGDDIETQISQLPVEVAHWARSADQRYMELINDKTGQVMDRRAVGDFSDMDLLKMGLTFIPGAGQILAGVNVLDAARTGNWTNALIGATGLDPSLANINTALRVGQAIDSGNTLGAITALAGNTDLQKLTGLNDAALGGFTAKDVMTGANLVKAAETGNYGAVVANLGTLANSSDTVIAGRALSLLTRFNNGDPKALLDAVNLSNAISGNKTAGATSTALQLAGLDTATASDAGNGYTLTGNDGSSLTFPNLNTSSILSDADLFNSGIGTLGATNTGTTGGTGLLDWYDDGTDDTDGTGDTEGTGGTVNDTVVDDKGVVTVVGGRESCPIGTKLNLATGECDPDWDETGVFCAPGFHDDGTGKCVPDDDKQVNTECPAGMIRDLATGQCVWPEEECAEGFHLENGLCVADDDDKKLDCPEGYEPNDDNTACIPVIEIQDTKCQPGYVYDEDLKQCVPKETGCAPGFHDDGTGLCVPDDEECSDGYHLEDGKCVPDECPEGYVRDLETGQCVPADEPCKPGFHKDDTGACVPDEEEPCKDGYHRNAQGVCVPDEQEPCKQGYHRNASGVCVPDDVPCEDGYHLENGVCVPDEDPCDEGYHRENGVCVQDECAEGYIRNLETGLCEKIDSTSCPPGQVKNAAGKCVPIVNPPPPVTCQPGYEKVNGVCVPICQPGYVRVNGVCKKITTDTAVPISGLGASGEKTDPIYAGGMDEFNLLATLQELLAEGSSKKDTNKSMEKTKMASGGHLDDLLAEQMTVDDLLKLLR